jgi:hypothetical protein
LKRLFRNFEAECNPYPLCLFRILFYAGLALHFGPSLLHFDANYGSAVEHATAWHALEHFRWTPSDATRGALAVSAVSGIVLGLVGLWPRLAAALAGIGAYGLACVGSQNTQTLALSYVWFVLWTWSVTGGGDEVLSVAAWRRRGPPRRATRLTRSLIAVHLTIGFFFAGIEKLFAGWLTEPVMGTLLKYPEFTILRPWAVGLTEPWASRVGKGLDTATLLVELGVPIAIMVRRLRTLALLGMVLFFVGILLLMEVPPLFGSLFCGAALLLADDQALAALVTYFRGYVTASERRSRRSASLAVSSHVIW